MQCSHCHQTVPNGARFCPHCGFNISAQHPDGRPREEEDEHGEEHEHHNPFHSIASRINRVAGFEEPVDIKLRDVFSETFKKHTEEDAEKMFIVGTRATTPGVAQLLDTWPKPWLFARVFIVVALVYIGLYLGVSLFGNINFLPGLIMVGAFMVPFTLLVFFWEMNAPQNIPIYRVVYVVFIGGIVSLVTALVLYESLGNYSGALITGFVEEAAKVLAVAWFLRRDRSSFILNGLLTGAAVGTGFAAFETAGYALRVVLQTSNLHDLYSTILWRGILAPGGHIVWAALSGAAICMVKGNRNWSWSMLLRGRFLRIFLITVVLHALWDFAQVTIFSVPVLQLVLTLLSWIIAFAMINAGLKEITSLKRQAAAGQEAAVGPADLSPVTMRPVPAPEAGRNSPLSH